MAVLRENKAFFGGVMKKFIAFNLALVILLLSFVGCDLKKDDDENSESEGTESTTADVSNLMPFPFFEKDGVVFWYKGEGKYTVYIKEWGRYEEIEPVNGVYYTPTTAARVGEDTAEIAFFIQTSKHGGSLITYQLNRNAEEVQVNSVVLEIKYLGEMMNYPGVIYEDNEVIRKIESAHRHNKPIDGHAPLLSGDDLKKYCAAGIGTDHECSSLDEAQEKINLGMKIQVREGSAAKNFNALIDIIKRHPENVMFCTDDAHPHELINGHINKLAKRAIDLGYNTLDVIKSATIIPKQHYNLEVGMLQKNDPADFIVIDNFKDFNVLKTYIDGNLVAENGKSLLPSVDVDVVNNFVAEEVAAHDFRVEDKGKDINIIGVINGELLTDKIIGRAKSVDGNLVSDVENDILKIAVVNRYENKKMAVGFIKNFGLKKGALASSVAHDSHNIVVIGCDDEAMARATNMIIKNKGGLAVYDNEIEMCLPLSVAGIMTNDDAFKVADDYLKIKNMAKSLGSNLSDPFMTMGFMALLVIPKLKLSDKGLFDCEKFELINLNL